MSLTQAIFKDAPDWVESAAIDECGVVHWLGCHSSCLVPCDGWLICSCENGCKSKIAAYGYDASNWQSSAIDRDY